jgi:hypothetical protein
MMQALIFFTAVAESRIVNRKHFICLFTRNTGVCTVLNNLFNMNKKLTTTLLRIVIIYLIILVVFSIS